MYAKEWNPAPVLMFAETPNLNELCTITVQLSKTAQQQTSLQPQILKCREIIFTEPNVIATPAYGIQNAFHIVLQQSLYRTGRIQGRFKKIGLEFSKPLVVTAALYESCLMYTLLARIAPKWNKAGSWLIQVTRVDRNFKPNLDRSVFIVKYSHNDKSQANTFNLSLSFFAGRDFLSSNGYAHGVKMNLSVNHDEVCFSLEATALRFHALQVDDLDICRNSYHNFLNNPQSQIDQCAISSPWCHVLPSMKKGQVVSISHEIPGDSPFKSYRDLKRHWKNTYGYRLPESEEGIVYYQVHFRPLGGRLFTYPEFCLRARDIERVPRVDPKPILTAFLQDVQAKLSSICGSLIKLQNKARYTTIELSHCDSQKSQQIKSNLSSRPAITNRKIIYRNPMDIQRLLSKNPNKTGPYTLSMQSVGCNNSIISTCSSNKTELEKSSTSADSTSGTVANWQTPKVSSTQRVEKTKCINDATAIPYSRNLNCDAVKAISCEGGSGFVSHNSVNDMHKSGDSKRIVPVFTAKKKQVLPSKAGKTSVQMVVPAKRKEAFIPEKGADINMKELSSDFLQKPVGVNPELQSKQPELLSSTSSSVEHKILQKTSLQKSFIKNSLPLCAGFSTFVNAHTSCSAPVQIPKKRPIQILCDAPKEKKSRAKPQIKDLDIENLARNNELHKANTVTLLAWLKQRGIACKAKDKKTDILDKVRAALNLTAEQ